MYISFEFDESNKKRRDRINNTALKTAEKLNNRIATFMNDVYKNPSLTDAQKKEIHRKVLVNI